MSEMRICAYTNGTTKCKNWITSNEEGRNLCPLHAGILKSSDHVPSQAELRYKERFTHHESLADSMSDDQLRAHIMQLEELLEDVKIRQQVAAHVRNKRVKALMGQGKLTDAQQAELATLRDPRMRTKPQEVAMSKEEKEIAKYVKMGFTREKAMRLLGLDGDE